MSHEDCPTTSIKELFGIIGQIKNGPLHNFMSSIFGSDKDLIWEFLKSAGSRNKHHAWPGGLAYHTVEAAKLGRSIAESYNARNIKIDTDLVIAGILLHDIGKIGTYIPDGVDENGKTKYKHNPSALLHHHIPIGYAMIDKMIDRYNVWGCDFEMKITNELRDKLLHIILSHHGRKSWSSPVTPQFIEAYVVHIVEFMDGVIDKFNGGEIPQDLYDH